MYRFKIFLVFSIFVFSACERKNDLKQVMGENVTAQVSGVPDERSNDGLKEIPVFTPDTDLPDSAPLVPKLRKTKINPTPVQSATPDWTKKVIKYADIKLEVKEEKKFSAFLNGKMDQYGAYISAEETHINEYQKESLVTVKVPVGYFDQLINELTSTDANLLDKTIKSSDVTGDIADTRARLEAKRQVKLKYAAFLGQSKNMEEVLDVENRIDEIQEEIEAATGRYKSLSAQSAFSTIQLSYIKKTGEEQATGFLNKFVVSFRNGTIVFENILIVLVSIWPLLVISGVIFMIYLKRKPAISPTTR